MSISLHNFENPGQPPPVPDRRFTVEEYRRMGAAGVLDEDDRVELLEGWIVPKMNRSPLHDAHIECVDGCLIRLIPDGWRVRMKSAISTLDSVPEPDLAVVRGDARQRSAHHPLAADVALVVEVADASLALDRSLKSRLYSRADIPWYWIVNLSDKCVEVFGEPDSAAQHPGYRWSKIYRGKEAVPLIVEGVAYGTASANCLV